MLRVPIKVSSPEPLEIPAGGTARFQVQMPTLPSNFLPKVQYELSEPPEGIELRTHRRFRDGTEIVLQCDAAKAKPGLKGNLIVSISAERVAQAANAKQQANRQRVLWALCRPSPSKLSCDDSLWGDRQPVTVYASTTGTGSAFGGTRGTRMMSRSSTTIEESLCLGS